MEKRFILLVIFFAISFAPESLVAQSQVSGGGKQINLKHANTLKGGSTKSVKYQRLIGEVMFEHQGMVMTCDSAHFYQAANSLEAYGHVHISQGDSINCWGEFLKYDGNTRKAELTKNVRMTDGDMTLSTEAISYDMSAKVASYVSGGKIISQNNTLTSQIGIYSTEAKAFSFKKNVVLLNPLYTMNCDTLVYMPVSKVSYFHGPTTIKATNNSNIIYCENGFYDTNADVCQFQKNARIVTQTQTLRGDSIWYNRKIGLGKAIRNVEIIDTTQNLTIRGDLATHDENKDISLVTGHALYIQSFETDSLYLHADTLKSITIHDSAETKRSRKDTVRKELPRIVLGYHNVSFYKPDLQGRCDSLSWTSIDSTMHLFGQPVLWSGGSQLTAEQITIQTANGKILRMDMDKSAFIISKEDSTRFNQIKGRHMTGYFRNNELYNIYVDGHGQTLYYAKDKGLLIGVNRADCSRLSIEVKDNDVQSISFYDKPEAILYPPLDLPPKEALLKDFIWRGAEQPLSVDDLLK